ncbi:drug/metabolite transporter (DMT)-like permease [Saccharothrix tamanrassetensis]|uniref:Drug/metabolite transporter (DMT)-like permease n=1 Tax=Saccharothrix tamanrassetensis TaxID=1051531 RepID=A0A841CHL4_9PSEU|nr:EamA family transporter [Saccharothrix tamanrassetensis]MBB5955678.1 drug/metabolite transporter (DMT)-like permease [Saccharothrix tamanrassetensis]
MSTRGLALALLSSLTFGMSGVMAKPVMAVGVTPVQVTSARIGIAAVVLLVFVASVRPRALRFARGSWALAAGYGLFGVIGAPLLFFVSAARIPVAIAMLLEFTAPILVALWVRFVRGTRLAGAVWWGMAVALLGLAVIGEVWRSLRLDTAGVLAGLASAVCTAAYYLLGERAAGRHDPFGVLALGMLVGAVALAVFSPPWLVPMGQSTELGPAWLLLPGLALVATALPYLAGMFSLRHLPSSAASVIGFLEPVVATVLAWWLLSEALNVVQVAGAVVLLGGAAVVQVASSRTVPVVEPVPTPG